jgi:putative flippase GtrA
MSQKMLPLVRKWMRFNAIGVMGVGVQLSVLMVLRTYFNFNPFVATFFALQFALVHNFLWHQRWTWSGNRTIGRRAAFRRFVRYTSSSGTISTVGTLCFTALLFQALNLPYVVCNLMAIGACNIANFLFSHTFVFQPVADAA